VKELIAIILRLIPIDIFKKYKIEAPYPAAHQNRRF
jgi:hypothetical protein